jgi:PDZ domain-containing protein
VVFTVRRGDQTLTIEVPTIANPEGATVVGVVARTADPSYTYPFEIAIASGDVSGPSAGLAFSLGIIDELTPGDLTGGSQVAVTGTISGSGKVGEIGSAREKAIVAKRSGAALMLVPEGNVDEARSAQAGIEIVGVRTLDEALAALAARGGAPVPNP